MLPHDDAPLVAEPLEDAEMLHRRHFLQPDFGSRRQADVGSDAISPQRTKYELSAPDVSVNMRASVSTLDMTDRTIQNASLLESS